MQLSTVEIHDTTAGGGLLLEAGRSSSSIRASPTRSRPVYVNRIPEKFGKRNPEAKADEGKMITSCTEPHLRWGDRDIHGVTSSGWNPFRGANVCFKDETSTKDKITLIIEPPAPGAGLSVAALLCVPYWPIICHAIACKSEAHGYFFEKNKETGKIDMIHRSKPFRGLEERKLYKDCTYFGVTTEQQRYPDGEIRDESMFVLTSGYSDKNFPTGINFSSSSCQELAVIVASINALIYSVQGDIDISATARVYPLFCTHLEFEDQCRVHDRDIAAAAQSRDSSETATAYSSDGEDDAPHYIEASSVQVIYPKWISNLSSLIQDHGETGSNEGEVESMKVHATCIYSPPLIVNARI